MRNGSRKNIILNRQVQTVASIQSKLLFQTKLRAVCILSSPQLREVDLLVFPFNRRKPGPRGGNVLSYGSSTW